jgi:dehydrogenase/reductase SDR family member 12
MGYSVLALAQWAWDGYRNYGRAGFERASRGWAADAIPADLSARTFIVTGANAGIGREVAAALAARKASVHCVCRDAARGQAAVDELRAAGNTDVHLHVADVSSAASVRAFAEAWHASGRPLHGLVNNAGVLLPARTLSADGLEAAWATAMGGSYLLTGLLLPALLAAAPDGGSRVVNLSSGGAYNVRLDLDDPQATGASRAYDGAEQYAHSKRAQIMLTEAWAARLGGTGVAVAAMHPGWAETPGVKTALPDFEKRQAGSLRTAAQGADTAVWLVAGTHGDGSAASTQAALGGKFFFDRAPVSPHKALAGTRSPPGDADRLWRYCASTMGWAYEGSPEEAAVRAAAAPAATGPAA